MAYFKRSGKITTNSINKKIDFNRKTTNNPPSPVLNTTGLFSSSFVDGWNRHRLIPIITVIQMNGVTNWI